MRQSDSRTVGQSHIQLDSQTVCLALGDGEGEAGGGAGQRDVEGDRGDGTETNKFNLM